MRIVQLGQVLEDYLLVGCRNSSVGRGAVLVPYKFESSQGQNIYMEKKKSDGMYVVWLLPLGRVVSQAYPWNAEICPGFPPPQTALRIRLSNEGDAVYR